MNSIFDKDFTKSQLNQNLKKGFFWTTLSRTIIILFQFIAMVVLARYLTPEEFALIGIAMFFINVSNLIVDAGMGGALVAKKTVHKLDFSTLFVFNLLCSLVLYFILLCFSSYIAEFYEINELKQIINIIGLSIIISAIGKIQNTIFTRKLMFKEIAIISIIASIVSLITAIILAILNYGIWALVIQNLIYVTILTTLQISIHPTLPRLGFSIESFKGLWKFGSPLFMSSSLQGVYSNLFLLIFPRISSLKFSGLYSQADKIGQIPTGVITTVIQSVVFPVLSRVDDNKEFNKTRNTLLKKVYLCSFSVFLFISIQANEIVAIVLGEQWRSAGSILSILSFSGIWLTVLAMSRVTLKSLSKTKKILHIEIGKTIIGISTLAITFHFGDYIIIFGIVLAIFLASMYSLVVISRNTSIKIKEQLGDLIAPILIPGFSCGITKLCLLVINPNELVSLFIALLFVPIIVIITGYIFKNNEVLEIIAFLKQLIANNSKS